MTLFLSHFVVGSLDFGDVCECRKQYNEHVVHEAKFGIALSVIVRLPKRMVNTYLQDNVTLVQTCEQIQIILFYSTFFV